MKRWTVALAATALAALGVAGPAAAQVYPPDEEPTISVDAGGVCVGDVPYLAYSASVAGTTATSVTITFNNPGGADHVIAGLPLSGTVLWPGAGVDGDGNATDWPGWRLVGEEWVEGDEWDWVVPEVSITFSVNPEVTVLAQYPLPSSVCASPVVLGSSVEAVSAVASDGQVRTLPSLLGLTGGQTLGLGIVVAVLMVAGVGLVVVRRRIEARAAQKS